MFLIKWLPRSNIQTSPKVVVGLSRYLSRDKAEEQVKKFRSLFRHNLYFIESVRK